MVEERAEWRRSLDSAAVRGVFTLQRIDPTTGRGTGPRQVSDVLRSGRRYLPASTFKIPNALLALELGVVTDERQRFPMTWPEQEVADWNRDHTFASALKYSVVPVFQIVARSVGEERYRLWLPRLGYGNADPSGGVDHFWLDGALRISAVEQLHFLGRLVARKLPISERSQRIVQAMLVREANECWTLRAKTGLVGVSAGRTLRDDERVGWYVGWVETDSTVHAFALNVDATPGAAAKRVGLAKALLVRAGVIPARCGR